MLTEMIMILDRSGSMSGLETDTIGGFNSMIDKQKKVEGDAVVTTVLFDTVFTKLHDRVDLKEIKPLTDNDYYARGCTALLDAVGQTMHDTDLIQKHAVIKPDKTVVVIITDGYENASRHYSYDEVAKMIKAHEELGWEFMFLGANIDAAKEAGRMGIQAQRAVRYHQDEKGVAANFETVERAFTRLRTNGAIEDDWADAIKEDYNNRS